MSENKLWEGTRGEGCHGFPRPHAAPPDSFDLDKKFPRVMIAAIVTRGSEILLGRSKEAKWVIPGGEVKPFESLPNTITRILREEANVDIRPGSTLFVSENFKPEIDHLIAIYVEADYLGGYLKAGGNFKDVCWVDVRQLGDMQDAMSQLTIDALHKFSLILKARAIQKKQSVFP
jgi:ADP-ribose pyrophosphatase YjhB (NUDIX family)